MVKVQVRDDEMGPDEHIYQVENFNRCPTRFETLEKAVAFAEGIVKEAGGRREIFMRVGVVVATTTVHFAKEHKP